MSTHTLTMPITRLTEQSERCEAETSFPINTRCKRQTWVKIGGYALCAGHIGSFVAAGEQQLYNGKALLDSFRNRDSILKGDG